MGSGFHLWFLWGWGIHAVTHPLNKTLNTNITMDLLRQWLKLARVGKSKFIQNISCLKLLFLNFLQQELKAKLIFLIFMVCCPSSGLIPSFYNTAGRERKGFIKSTVWISHEMIMRDCVLQKCTAWLKKENEAEDTRILNCLIFSFSSCFSERQGCPHLTQLLPDGLHFC